MNMPDDAPGPMDQVKEFMKGPVAREGLELGRFAGGVAAVYLGLVTFFFAAFHIPSESMQPSLEVGDRVLVSKWAYGYSRHSLPLNLGYAVPESWDGRIGWASPRRGDVVVVRDERQRINLIKRVTAIAGDVVEVRNGQLWLNGEAVPRELVDERIYREYRSGAQVSVAHYSETLPGDNPHPVYEHSDVGGLDNYGPTTVLPGTVFVMGDNRDRSNDSRAPGGPGLVPLANVVGRAETVLFTLQKCPRADREAGMHCPTGRVWSGL